MKDSKREITKLISLSKMTETLLSESIHFKNIRCNGAREIDAKGDSYVSYTA